MKLYKLLTIIFTVLFLSSNAYAAYSASQSKPSSDESKYDYNYAELTGKCEIYDPYESINRKVYVFNGVLDTFLLRPIARWYDKITNDFAKNRIGSFVDNIEEPLSLVNYAAQGKFKKSFKSFWKFVINSTTGVAGFFDVAGKTGISLPQQNMGNTLAHYGVGPGPYIVLPIFGGMGARDAMNPIIFDSFMNPIKYVLHKDFKYIASGVSVIHYRSKIMPFTDYVTKTSPDSYIAIRNAILSQKESKMEYPDNFVCPVVKR